MFEQVHHVGYMVTDLDAAVALFQDKLGLRLKRRWHDEASGTSFALMYIGDTSAVVELINPPAERGQLQGLHHVAYLVDELDSKLADIRAQGIKTTQEQPMVSPAGWRVIGLDTASTLGLLIQLVDAKQPG